ncbi:hypothetical protein Tco_1019504 [Tanacetum coccineum]|uniref:Uncharacterized protein n=1 Tax=Tanacetum coccineum TaxID=301880 RepID=A0ABQ5FXT0_9ASTR
MYVEVESSVGRVCQMRLNKLTEVSMKLINIDDYIIENRVNPSCTHVKTSFLFHLLPKIFCNTCEFLELNFQLEGLLGMMFMALMSHISWNAFSGKRGGYPKEKTENEAPNDKNGLGIGKSKEQDKVKSTSPS